MDLLDWLHEQPKGKLRLMMWSGWLAVGAFLTLNILRA